MQHFGIAKSTLWRWLNLEGLVETHPQKLTELKRLAQRKGAATVKAARLARTATVMQQARGEVGRLSGRDLWWLGTALYWGEGAKQKPHNVSAQVSFSNSDPAAIRLMMRWFQEICGVSAARLSFEIYLHETADAERARRYWAHQLGLSREELSRIRWKRHRPATRRTNVGDSYYGLIRLRVSRSAELNRRIAGWIVGICDSLGSGVTVTHQTLDLADPGSIPGSPAIVADGNGHRYSAREMMNGHAHNSHRRPHRSRHQQKGAR